MKRPPIKFIVQIDENRLSELIYYWNYYDKPCDLLLRKPKTAGLAAVVLTVDNDEAADFLFRVKEKTGARLHQLNK
jgi:hypothetical protein bfra3_07172|nr:MAG TPA: hypothetical protein [Caudoviricetes sp.]